MSVSDEQLRALYHNLAFRGSLSSASYFKKTLQEDLNIHITLARATKILTKEDLYVQSRRRLKRCCCSSRYQSDLS